MKSKCFIWKLSGSVEIEIVENLRYPPPPPTLERDFTLLNDQDTGEDGSEGNFTEADEIDEDEEDSDDLNLTNKSDIL